MKSDPRNPAAANARGSICCFDKKQPHDPRLHLSNLRYWGVRHCRPTIRQYARIPDHRPACTICGESWSQARRAIAERLQPCSSAPGWQGCACLSIAAFIIAGHDLNTRLFQCLVQLGQQQRFARTCFADYGHHTGFSCARQFQKGIIFQINTCRSQHLGDAVKRGGLIFGESHIRQRHGATLQGRASHHQMWIGVFRHLSGQGEPVLFPGAKCGPEPHPRQVARDARTLGHSVAVAR